jgi:hypothetical protein
MPAATYDRYRPRDRTLRVGDADREAVAELLRHQHVEGRLDGDEFQERLDRCLAAKTYADLDELIADLPGTEGPERVQVARPWGRWPRPVALLPLALIAAIVVSGGHLLWLAFPLVFFFVVRPLLWASYVRRGGRRRDRATAPVRPAPCEPQRSWRG